MTERALIFAALILAAAIVAAALYNRPTPADYCRGTTGVYPAARAIQPYDPACGGAE